MLLYKLLFVFFFFTHTSLAGETIDLFIWAGQSNAQGWMGNAEEYPKDELDLDHSILLNWTFFGKESSKGEWVNMQPQTGRFPLGHFGPEVSFARELKKAGYNPAIFKYCLGATGLARDWKAPGGGGIYDQMIKDLLPAIQKLKDKGYSVNIRGFIWIQGESDGDSDVNASAYYENLKRLIDNLRNTVLNKPDLKIILGVDEQHPFMVKRPMVVQAQKSIAEEDKNISFTTMIGLPKADATHLTPEGLTEHGKRIFEAYRNLDDILQNKTSQKKFADHWEFKGIAVQEAGYHIWGTSPIMDDEGKVHLFVARWPKQYAVDPGWRSHSEIAHYIGDTPEGPFKFSDVSLQGSGVDTWDKYGMHNPTIHKVGDQFVLLYIANSDYHQPPHPANQNIGMAVSKSLGGPWRKVGVDGKILTPPKNPAFWNHNASNGVVNPTLLQYNGGFFLYFKSEAAKMGLAIAENIEGPYVQLPLPVTANNRRIEDGYAFAFNGKICLLTTDNDGIVKKGGGLLWKSDDGIHFNSYEAGYHLINEYIPDTLSLNPKWYYGPRDRMKFERPQVLMKNGKPGWLYVAAGCNIYGGESTVSYVLKYRE